MAGRRSSLLAVLTVSLFVVKDVVAQTEKDPFSRGSHQTTISFFKNENSRLHVTPVSSQSVQDAMSCAFKCLETAPCVSYNLAASPDNQRNIECQLLATDKYSSSGNFTDSDKFHHYSIKSPCDLNPCKNEGKCRPVFGKQDYTCDCLPGYDDRHCGTVLTGTSSCGGEQRNGSEKGGVYDFMQQGLNFTVYCHTAANRSWTLIARFSNKDAKNWMKNDGEYWYDKKSAVGKTIDPEDNADMLSPAFWFISGTEFKITRSDDSNHTALLHTTDGCLGGETFRSKITSYGIFKDGAVWASNLCRGSCAVKYGGLYNSTEGFELHGCEGGIQAGDRVGFWCDYGNGDGAVIMVGGGGEECMRADHGIGITEANEATFDFDAYEYDFGSDANHHTTSNYSLNLWIG